MTLPANIRVNVRAPFPSRAQGSAFIQVAKANGVYTIKPDYTVLVQNPGVDANQIVALQDKVTGVWSYVSALAFISGAANSYRVVSSVGTFAVQPADVVILLQKASSGASTANLPTSASRGGVPFTIKDLTGDANTNNITIVPAAGETIDGLSASAAVTAGVALIDTDYGSRTLYPLLSGGWYTL